MSSLKEIWMRGPDGKHKHWFTTGLDDWVPTPGQDFVVGDVLTGAGWYTVTAVRPIYAGSQAHTSIARRVAGVDPSTVYLRHLEVYLEDKVMPE